MGWRAALVLGFCLILLFYLRDHPLLERPRQFGIDVAASAYSLASAPGSAWQMLAEFFRSHSALRSENERLSQENLVLRGQTQKLASVLAENTRYRALLRSAESIEREVMVAEIIALSAAPARLELVLDKGSRDGVSVGQPLLGPDGLMGQVVDVGSGASRALLITDATHAVPIQVLRSGVRGLAEGTGELDRLIVRHIAVTTDIERDDILVTSGLGGRFPAGYPVARVIDRVQVPGSAFFEVIAEPLAALDRGRHVMIALEVPDTVARD